MAKSFERPVIDDGYLGPQPGFEANGLSTFGHDEPEFKTKDNVIEIKLRTTKPMKFSHQLVSPRMDNKDCSEYVLTQTKDKVVSFLVHMPQSDYYKFQIYSLPASEQSKTLPNVYNYLIQCDRAVTPVYPFPKQYALWKDGCYVFEPQVLHKDSKLAHVNWKVNVPKARAVAVVADGEWHHFKQEDGNWVANFNLVHLRGKDAKVTINACFGDDDTKYSALLEYKL